jgi:hypothetical protein
MENTVAGTGVPWMKNRFLAMPSGVRIGSMAFVANGKVERHAASILWAVYSRPVRSNER